MFIFRLTTPFCCGCIIPSFSRKWDETLLKYSFLLSNLMTFILTLNCVLTIWWKIENAELTSYLFFMKYNQFTLIQSSIKDANHMDPKRLTIREGPQTSVWNNKKGNVNFVLLKGNGTWWCLANWQTSQWKLLTSNLLNNKGNFFLAKKRWMP